MNEIYLVQNMSAEKFKHYAKKGVKVNYLDCYDQVITNFATDKQYAIKCCRRDNRTNSEFIYFVTTIKSLEI